jgi:hypothetical protein
MTDDLENTMRKLYRNVIRDLLVSELLGHKDLAPDYFALSGKKQDDIEKEIDAKSVEISDDLVSELKKRDFLEKQPSDKELQDLIREVMRRHGAGK